MTKPVSNPPPAAGTAAERPVPARPRDAASLVIHRRRRTHHEVLMGRRGSQARFKPGVYVFPGGGLDRADYQARPVRPLDSTVEGRLGVGRAVRKANALAMAAVREAAEEAGLHFGVPGDVGTVRHATWAGFRARDLAPDLAALTFLGRAITPSHQPLRYHARFFAAPYEACHGELAGDGELEDLRWVRLDDTAGMEMMAVQQLILDQLGRRLAGKDDPPLRLFFHWGRRNLREA